MQSKPPSLPTYHKQEVGKRASHCQQRKGLKMMNEVKKHTMLRMDITMQEEQTKENITHAAQLTTHVQLNAKVIKDLEPEGMTLDNAIFEGGSISFIPDREKNKLFKHMFVKRGRKMIAITEIREKVARNNVFITWLLR